MRTASRVRKVRQAYGTVHPNGHPPPRPASLSTPFLLPPPFPRVRRQRSLEMRLLEDNIYALEAQMLALACHTVRNSSQCSGSGKVSRKCHRNYSPSWLLTD